MKSSKSEEFISKEDSKQQQDEEEEKVVTTKEGRGGPQVILQEKQSQPRKVNSITTNRNDQEQEQEDKYLSSKDTTNDAKLGVYNVTHGIGDNNKNDSYEDSLNTNKKKSENDLSTKKPPPPPQMNPQYLPTRDTPSDAQQPGVYQVVHSTGNTKNDSNGPQMNLQHLSAHHEQQEQQKQGQQMQEHNTHQRRYDPRHNSTSVNHDHHETYAGAYAVRQPYYNNYAGGQNSNVVGRTTDNVYESELPAARVVDDDELRAKFKAPTKDSVFKKMKDEATVAIEVTHDQGHTWKQKVMIVIGVVLTVIIIGVVLGIVYNKKQNYIPVTQTPAPSNESEATLIYLQEVILPISGNIIYEDELSPQYYALEWLTYNDLGTEMSIDDIKTIPILNLLHRYVLAVIYFSTTTKDSSWKDDSYFLTKSSFCDWHIKINEDDDDDERLYQLPNGIWCDNSGMITKIVLDRNDLNGTIPSEISTIKSLEEISLSGNYLYGTIPNTIGDLFRLKYLDVGSNNLIGTLPNSLSNLYDMEYFSIRSNQLKGTIPSNVFTNLISLERFDLSGNSLTGTIPEFTKRSSSSLEHIQLFSNHLDGTIPESIQLLSNLEILVLSDNSLTSTIPSVIGNLKRLETLTLVGNHLTGPIPTTIGQMEFLIYFNVGLNNLNGTIPTEFGQLIDLQSITLSANNFIGTLPSELSQCTDLSELYLTGNLITGSVPSSFSMLSNLRIVRLMHTGLTGSIDDIFCNIGNTYVSANCEGTSPLIECSCCIMCCDHETGQCEGKPNLVCNTLEEEVISRGFKAECDCGDNALGGFSCISQDECESCNDDGTICGFNQEFGYSIVNPLHLWKSFENTFQYTIGRNESITWHEVPDVDCFVWINGQQCKECTVHYCRDGYPARHIDCTNIITDTDDAIYDTCQHYKKGGVFEFISWADEISWIGCLPYFYEWSGNMGT